MSFRTMLIRCRTSEMCGAGRKRAIRMLLLSVSVAAGAQTSASPSGGKMQSAQNPAKQPEAQPQSDLADAARQARDERERQRAQRSANSETLNAMATELAESSEQAIPAP